MHDSADGSQRRVGFICGRTIDTGRFAAVSWRCRARDDGSMFAIVTAASCLLLEMKRLLLLLALGLVTAWPSAAHATAIARAGIYDFAAHHDHILVPVVLHHWGVESVVGLNAEAEAARERLVSYVGRVGAAARRLRERRELVSSGA